MEHDMNAGESKAKSHLSGITVGAFLGPMLLFLLGLHVAIFGLIAGINSSSADLSSLMQHSSEYVDEATSLLAGSSLLSETSTTFVMNPVLGNGKLNLGPLYAYNREIVEPHRGPDVLAKLEGTDASPEAIAAIKVAAEDAQYMVTVQLKSIALVDAVHDLPDEQGLHNIVLPALSDEEAALPDEAKLERAEALLTGTDYGNSKGSVSSNVNKAIGVIQGTFAARTQQTRDYISSLRIWLWIIASAIVIALGVTFFVLIKGLVRPLVQSVSRLNSGEALRKDRGFREFRLFSSSYNELKERRDSLDELLRLAAEKDVLTGLSNRYAFDQHFQSLRQPQSEENCIAICLFDVNFLKETNDHFGHSAGDALLREAGYCITTCFPQGHSYRIGGDEFATIVVGLPLDALEQQMKRFAAMQKEKNISVAFGFAFAPSQKDTDLNALYNEADTRMYEQKAAMHDKANPFPGE